MTFYYTGWLKKKKKKNVPNFNGYSFKKKSSQWLGIYCFNTIVRKQENMRWCNHRSVITYAVETALNFEQSDIQLQNLHFRR